jgi:hypothetical protein
MGTLASGQTDHRQVRPDRIRPGDAALIQVE